MTKRPFVIVGDGPNEPTGLGRIARDLAAQIQYHFGNDLNLLHIGGPTLPRWGGWLHLPMAEADRGDDWGASFVEAAYQDEFGAEPGILLVVWDPSRLYPYLGCNLPVERWAYAAVDGTNVQGAFGGPAAVGIRGFDRVLGYGRWGGEVLQQVRGESVAYLPHGISFQEVGPREAEGDEWLRQMLGPIYKNQPLVGCVATNQPRKDLALYCGALRELLDRGYPVHGWLHTDVLVKAWSVPQLLADYGLQKHLSVSTGVWTEAQLATAYKSSTITIAPGLSEGFGYPIVESLAHGTPVVGVDHGGGRELIPMAAWRFPVRELRTEGIYGLRRPVCRAEDVANAIERVHRWQEEIGEATVRAYCQGAVAHLEWGRLWPRWQAWVRQGLGG